VDTSLICCVQLVHETQLVFSLVDHAVFKMCSDSPVHQSTGAGTSAGLLDWSFSSDILAYWQWTNLPHNSAADRVPHTHVDTCIIKRKWNTVLPWYKVICKHSVSCCENVFSNCWLSASCDTHAVTSRNNFWGDAYSTDATPLTIFNKKLTMTTVTRQWSQDSHLYQHSA